MFYWKYMYIESAKELFHGKEGYNCAQAILAAFKDRYSIEQSTIELYKKYGGGRAEDNTCGAIYALKEIIKSEKDYLDLRKKFAEKASSYQCKPIRKSKILSCRECVVQAAKLLEGYL